MSCFCEERIPARRSGPAVPEAGNAGILLRRSTGWREPDIRFLVFGERMVVEAEAKARLGPGSGDGVRGGLRENESHLRGLMF